MPTPPPPCSWPAGLLPSLAGTASATLLALVGAALALPARAAPPAPPPAPAVAAPAAQPAPPAAVPAPAVDGEPDQHEDVRPMFGVQCAIRVQHPDGPAARKAIAAAMGEIARISTKFDGNVRGSEVAAVNATAPTEEVLVSEETHVLLQRCLDLCRRTAGAFDLTVASFDYLWNFAARPFVRPLPDEVAARRALSGCRQVAIKPGRAVRILQPGVRVTLQDIVRGHAAEQAAQVLREAGITNFRIRIGADVYVQGRAGTRHWFAAVPHPRDPEATVAQIYLGSQYAATRSDTDRFVLKGGRRYHDVLDPRTGQPAEGVVQATVIATDPTLADALSTAVFVLGPNAGLALLAREKNVEGFVVDRSGKVHATKGMAEFARLPPKVQL